MTARCAVVGATGIAGQQFLAALKNHPFFEVARLAASSRSAGKRFKEAVTRPNGQVAWYVAADVFETYADMEVFDGSELALDGIDLVFSAVESDAARALETRYAAHLPVVSTASAYRYEADVPIIIPAVNGAHASLIDAQKRNRDWKGFVVPIPNCTTTGLAIALAPLHTAFGIDRVVMTSLQATSGAGRSPGVIAQDVVDNVIPYIPKEEEKVERETQKILGALENDTVSPADFRVSATCTRVPVLDGHTETVTVALKKEARLDQVKEVFAAFGQEINPTSHPSAPAKWVVVHEDPFRPQPRWDRDTDDGMATSVGRIRPDDVLGPHGFRFVLVSHNTKMGAAKGALLVAEDLKSKGYIG